MCENKSIAVRFLREENRLFKKRERDVKRKMRSRKFLRQEIASHHNIFQNSFKPGRSMLAQNLLWDQNYCSKEAINALRGDNNLLRARIWNYEKENRRMDRQIGILGLQSCLTNPLSRTYVQTSAAKRVLNDQDHSIVSIKMEIARLQREYSALQQILTVAELQIANTSSVTSCLDYDVLHLKGQLAVCTNYSHRKQQVKEQLKLQNQRINMAASSTQARRSYHRDMFEKLERVSAQLELYAQISSLKLDEMQEELQRIQIEEVGQKQSEAEALRWMEEETINLESAMQQRMNEFIKRKISLNLEIETLKERLLNSQ